MLVKVLRWKCIKVWRFELCMLHNAFKKDNKPKMDIYQFEKKQPMNPVGEKKNGV